MDEQKFDGMMAVAIQQELDAKDFYLAAAALVSQPGTAEILRDLAREEDGHRRTLEAYRSDPSLAVKFPDSVDFGVAEAQDEPRLSTSLTPADALQLAIKKEQQAMEAYAALARATEDAALKAVWEELSQMEQNHKVRLESLFVDAAFPEAW